MPAPDESLTHLLFALALAAVTSVGGLAVAAIGYFLKSERERVNNKLDAHDKSSGEHSTDIATLKAQQTGMAGWLQSIDDRMTEGFRSLSDKIDRLTERG